MTVWAFFMTNIPRDCEMNAHSPAVLRPTLGTGALALSLYMIKSWHN